MEQSTTWWSFTCKQLISYQAQT